MMRILLLRGAAREGMMLLLEPHAYAYAYACPYS